MFAVRVLVDAVRVLVDAVRVLVDAVRVPDGAAETGIEAGEAGWLWMIVVFCGNAGVLDSSHVSCLCMHTLQQRSGQEWLQYTFPVSLNHNDRER